MEAMLGPMEGNPYLPSQEPMRQMLDRYNSLVHGDPVAALHRVVMLDDGSPGFTLGKDVASPARADEVCWKTTMWLLILDGTSRLLFPPEK
jgi:hypothetical protein